MAKGNEGGDYSLQKNLVVNNKQIVYKGIFKADELFSLVNRSLEDRGYSKNEKRSEEMVTPSGRKMYLELRPFKIVTNYITLMIKIKFNFENVTEAVKEIDGQKRRFDQGDAVISFDSWSITDYESRWGMQPLTYFLKGVVNKYLYKFPLEKGSISTLVGDTAYIYGQLKKLLNSYEGKESKTVKEEDVMKEMEKDILGDV